MSWTQPGAVILSVAPLAATLQAVPAFRITALDMDAYHARGPRFGIFVFVLALSGCTLPGPVPVGPTGPQPFSSGQGALEAGVPSWKGDDPACTATLNTPAPRCDDQTIVTPAPASSPPIAKSTSPKRSSATGRKRADKAHRGSNRSSQESSRLTLPPAATPGAPATTQDDEDNEEDEDDKDSSKGKPAQAEKKDGESNGKNHNDSMSNEDVGDDEGDDDKTRSASLGDKTVQDEDEERHEEEDFKTDLLDSLLGLQESRLGVFGWVEANYTANPQVGVDGKNFMLIPNSLANAFVFQQLYLVFEQKIKYRDQIDWGFRVDNLFGADSQNFHDIGLLNKTFAPNTFGYDPVQFYGELHLPIGGGIDIRGGRFFALPGYETATAPGRPLLSTTNMFSFGAHPYTQFGVLTTWHITDRFELYNGVVNGWNHWISDRNPWSYAGGFNWESKDERTNLTFTLNAGFTQFARVFPDEVNGVPTPPQLTDNPRLPQRSSNTTLFSTVLTHKWTDDLTMVIEADLATVNQLAPLLPGMPEGHASYYGLAGWFLYAFTDKVTGVARAEVFRDNNGLLTGFADNFYESTLGLIYKPFPWLWFRPETRFDWAQFTRPYYDDNADDHYRTNYRLTFGFDAIFIF